VTYRSIAHTDHEDTGYGFSGFTDLAIREDGKRFRMCIAGFSWCGNQGGYTESARFGNESEAQEFWSEFFSEHSEVTWEEFIASHR
jgi:hypothetical protein